MSGPIKVLALTQAHKSMTAGSSNEEFKIGKLFLSPYWLADLVFFKF
jgi:hypothetical protein